MGRAEPPGVQPAPGGPPDDNDRACSERGVGHVGPLSEGALRVLATEAPGDEIAARTLLQALLGGVVRVVAGVVHDEPDSVGEVVSIAWNRIRTYPPQRPGPVAANVVLDVRKEFLRNRATIECPVEPEVHNRRFGTDPNPTPGPGRVRAGVVRRAPQRPGAGHGLPRRAGDDHPYPPGR